MRPIKLSKAALIGVLNDIISLIEDDDSMEGSLEYSFGEDCERDEFMVQAAFRTGNSMGQGGMAMIGDVTAEGVPIVVTTEMGKFALSELKRVGMFDQDADYGPDFAEAIVKTVETFGASYGHSGQSAELGLELINRLIRRVSL